MTRSVQKHVLVVSEEPSFADEFRAICPADDPGGPGEPSGSPHLADGLDAYQSTLTQDGKELNGLYGSGLSGLRGDAGEILRGLAIDAVVGGQEAEEALRRAIRERRPFPLAVVDWERSGAADGIAAADRLGEIDPSLTVLLAAVDVAALRESVAARTAMPDRYWLVSKPLDRIEVRQLVALQLERRLIQTRLRRSENQLNSARRTLDRARLAAEETEQFKRQFMANVSHEIRTPMNAILGFSRLLLKEQLTEGQAEKVRYVHDAGNALLGIINNVLDFSKLTAGCLKPNTKDFQLDVLLREVLDVARPAARQKGLAMHYHAEPSIPRRLRGDATRFRQVLANLVDNAVKFTEHGSIHIQTTLDDDTESLVTLRTVVTDSGVGIPPDRQAVIFDSFAQADGSPTRQFDGLGLGLTISKYLADLLGGQIGFRSTPQGGSSFWFTAAFQKQAASRQEQSGAPPAEPAIFDDSQDLRCPPAAAGPQKLRVLAADDDRLNRTLLEAFLGRAGCLVDLVADGDEALAVLKNGHYDLILMDLQMPRLDGLETVQRIRRDEAAVGRRTPIILMTAQSSDAGRQRCLDAGADNFLAKPWSPESLFDAIGCLIPAFTESLRDQAASPAAHQPDDGQPPEQGLEEFIPALRRSLERRDFLDLEERVRRLRHQATRAGRQIVADHAMRIQLAARGRHSDRIRAAIDRLDHVLQGDQTSAETPTPSVPLEPMRRKSREEVPHYRR